MTEGVALASDERGRVPFALLGVLLLVSSLALAPTLGSRPAVESTAVERALAEATAASETAIRDGVATAGRRAAANPVVEPADTAAGRALNDSQPFRDALRLRIYTQVRDRLDRLAVESDGVTVTASLPAVDSTTDYERAIDRVAVERAGANGTAVRATVRNVTMTVRRGDRVVTRRTVTRQVVVPTPVLYVHERVQTYERRLNADLGHPGLSQRATARLYPIAWARGYAQYGGAPIGNVVANRHVSLATNGGLLGVQRSVFGRSDPAGRQALTEATAFVGSRDIASAGSSSGVASQVLSRTNYEPASQNITTGTGTAGTPTADDTMTIGINETADRAFTDVASPLQLAVIASDAYQVEARVVTRRHQLAGGRPDRPDPPGEGWTYAGSRTTSTATVVGTASERPGVPDGWHTLDGFGRVVEVTYERVATWRNDSRPPRTTDKERTERVLVTAAVVGRHRDAPNAPSRGIETAHDPAGSPIGGANLANIESEAETRLLGSGPDSTARAIAQRSFEERRVTLTGDRPEAMRAWVYRDLRDLRERVRRMNTTVERGSVGTFETNPARKLRAKLDRRRAALVDVPETYDSAAQRARVAARIAYLDAVRARLTERIEQRSGVKSRFAEQIQKRTGGSLAAMRRGLTARDTRVPRARPVPTGPAGPVRTRVSAQPQYLTLADVSESNFPAVEGTERPLAARNVNVFSVPYGEAAGAIVDAHAGTNRRATLASASQALAAADRTNVTGGNETLSRTRGQLRVSVREANVYVAGALEARVAGVLDVEREESQAMTRAGLSRWERTAHRGLSLANGSAADRIAAVAAQRKGLSAVEEDWLRLQLRQTTTKALARAPARPDSGVVNRTANAVRSVGRERLQMALEDQLERGAKDLAKKRLGTRTLPAGLPLAPPLTPWYATTNVWWVSVRGEYARFSVTASHGTPTTPGATVRYAREDESVTVDVDDDGSAERLGRNERISFSVETGVVVVVPPKPRGVGDKNGNTVEESGGWPRPG